MSKRLSADVLLDEESIETTVAAMAQAIAADTPEETPLTVVTVMDGAFMFCADLVRRLPMPVYLGFLKLISIDRGGQPDAIVFPISTEQVAAAIRVARRHAAPVTPRGAGTGLSGGAVCTSWSQIFNPADSLPSIQGLCADPP